MNVTPAADVGQKLDTDVLVVGSGAAGAVVACELAEAGRDVVVLEEGAFYTPQELGAMRPSQSIRRVWRDNGTAPALGLGDTPTILVQMGKMVGGSSALTGGVCFRIPGRVLAKWSGELGLSDLTPEGLEPYFESVEKAIHVETVPVDARSRSTALYAQGAERLGYHLHATRRNTEGCEGRSLCNFSCPHAAKRSVDLTYLPRAVAAGARIVSRALVEKVLVERDRAVGVIARVLDDTDRAGRRFEVRARTVVLAAGAWHTPVLLLRSGIGRNSGEVGRHMTVHPAFRVAGLFDERVDGWNGVLQSAYTDDHAADGITLISFFLPPSVLVTGLPGVGPDFMERAGQAGHLGVFGGIIHDTGGGTVRTGIGREPFVTYRMSARDRALVPRILRLVADTWFAAGARQVYLPVMGSQPVDADGLRSLDLEHVPARSIECTSQHPLGTARMGADPLRSVVNPDGRTWDVQSLYVADGSILPTCLGVNPQLAIMAMAARIAWKLRDNPS